MDVEREPDVGNGDAEPLGNGGDRDDDSAAQLHGLGRRCGRAPRKRWSG